MADEKQLVVEAARALMNWINCNVGTTADWPAGFSTDSKEAADEWCKKLNALQAALKPFRPSDPPLGSDAEASSGSG